MNGKHHRAMWTAALRSGEYHQTRNKLRDGSGFCCLGVACDISDKGAWVGTDGDLSFKIETDDRLLVSTVDLPPDVMRHLGIKDTEGNFDLRDLPNALQERIRELLTRRDVDHIRLSIINDLGGDFDLIADIIDAAPPSLLAQGGGQ